MKMIPVDERKNYRCHFCGTDLSVKYKIDIPDKYGNQIEVPSCNRCCFVAFMEKHKEDNNG